MDKSEIVAVLAQMAVLLELKGENPFKVRAYENAARALENLAEDIDALIREEKLTTIKGIGRNLADHIAELSKTGRLKEYERLKANIPEDVIQMLAIPGLGPKRVRTLWEEYRVKSVGELEMACQRHMIESIPGFGEKMREKILAGIAMLKRFSGKRLFAEGYFYAEEVHGLIKKWPEVIRSEIAGSIRRRKEIIQDIDILVATKEPETVMRKFVSLPIVDSVVAKGETKSEVILKSGIQCDLRAVSEKEYPFALYYFTGSKEHNVAMRVIAKAGGIKMNEYGLFKGDSERSIPCKDEKEIFGVFGMDYVEPELREDMGEVEAAKNKKLPKLVKADDLKGLVHCHSNYTDGENSIEELATAAKKMGYEYIVICDHSKAVTVANGMRPADVNRQHKEIDALNKKLKGIRVIKGIECDILADGSMDFNDDLLATFEVVIGAVHSRFGMSKEDMTKRIVTALSNPDVDILAHPTGRLLLSRDGYEVDMDAVINAAAKYKKIIEINCHPQRLDLEWRLCKRAKEKGVKFVICPDAHAIESFSDVQYGINIARKGWLEKGDVINCLTLNEFLKIW